MIVPYNAMLALIASIVPDFEGWYIRRNGLEQAQTHERIIYGLAFIPAIKYTVGAAGDFLASVQLPSRG